MPVYETRLNLTQIHITTGFKAIRIMNDTKPQLESLQVTNMTDESGDAK